MQQHAAGRAAQERSEQTGTASEEQVDVGEEPGNDDKDDAVDDELELAHDHWQPGCGRPSGLVTGRPQQAFRACCWSRTPRRAPQKALRRPDLAASAGRPPPVSRARVVGIGSAPGGAHTERCHEQFVRPDV